MEIATYFLDETCYSKTYNVLTTLYIACFYLSMYYYICKSLLIHIFVLFYQYRNLKVKNDPRSEFSNLSNWKEEA